MIQFCKSVLFFVSLLLFSCEDSGEKVAKQPKNDAASSSRTAIFADAESGKIWNIFGLEIVGKIMGYQTNGQYSVVVSTTPPDGGLPLHEHEDELFYVLEGEYEFRYGEQKVRVSKGRFVYLPRKLPPQVSECRRASGLENTTGDPNPFYFL